MYGVIGKRLLKIKIIKELLYKWSVRLIEAQKEMVRFHRVPPNVCEVLLVAHWSSKPRESVRVRPQTPFRGSKAVMHRAVNSAIVSSNLTPWAISLGGEMVNTAGLKPAALNRAWGFESLPEYHSPIVQLEGRFPSKELI